MGTYATTFIMRNLPLLPPQNQGIFDRIRVVIAPSGGDAKPQLRVQRERRRVGLADLERGAPRSVAGGLRHHFAEQEGRHPAAPEEWADGERIDVELVEDDPHDAEANRPIFRIP